MFCRGLDVIVLGFAASVPAAAMANGLSQSQVLEVPGEFATIQSALDAASDGMVIEVRMGVYEEHLDFNGKGVTLIAVDDRDLTVLRGSDFGVPVVNLHGPDSGHRARISGFTIEGGAGHNGGAVFASGLSEINGCASEGNEADLGGAIFAVGSIRVNDSEFVDNTARLGGAIYAGPTGEVRILRSEFSDNASEAGGAIYASATVEGSSSEEIDVIDSVFQSNFASSGGAIMASYRSIDINGSSFSWNDSESDGGAVTVSEGTLVVDSSRMRGNLSANIGGAVAVDQGSMFISHETAFLSNFAVDGSAVVIGETANAFIGSTVFCANGSDEIVGEWGRFEANDWGCDGANLCLADVSGDGRVNADDLFAILSAFGTAMHGSISPVTTGSGPTTWRSYSPSTGPTAASVSSGSDRSPARADREFRR